MTKRTRQALIGAVLLVGVGAAGWLGGRSAAPKHDRGFVAGNTTGYAAGLAAGRALQIGDSVPPASKAATVTAFKAGYRAGQNDSFGAYDGGWKMDFPYVVVLADGVGGATYQIASRIQFEPGTTYRLCPDGHSICH
jgi:hypothetical protein